MNNRRIFAFYIVVLATLLAAVAIKQQSLGFGRVLEARNQTIMTTGTRPVANTGCTCGQPRPVRACGSHCGGGGIIYVP